MADGEWACLEPLIPAAKPGGRPCETNMREAVNAILYLLRTGCPWRYQSWLGEFEQGDKWSFCLTVARMAADQERVDDETSAPEPLLRPSASYAASDTVSVEGP